MIRYSFFGYALASAIIFIICGMAYQFFFASKVKPKINRFIILLIFLLGVTIPLIAVWFIEKPISEPESIIVGTPMIVNVYLTSESPSMLSKIITPFIPYLNYLYLTGMGLMALTILISLVRLCKLKKKAKKVTLNGIEVYLHDNFHLASFSWINSIYIYRKAMYDDLEALLNHEIAHVRHLHWIDIIISQIIMIFQWFNPAVWILKKQLQEVHEYQADNSVISSGINETDYQMLLIRNVSKGRTPILVAGIKSCSLKKRLLMMNKKNFKSNWRLRSFSVALGTLCGIIILQMPVVADVVETKSPLPQKNIIFLERENQSDVIYHIDNKEVTYEEVRNFDSSKIAWVEVFKGDKKYIGLVTNEYNDKNPVRVKQNPMKRENSPLKEYLKDPTLKLDQLPSYRGGNIGLKRDLNILSYQFFNKKIKGTVEVGFTVTAEGNVSNFKILHSLDSEIDIAAVNLIQSLSGKWSPGMIGGKPIDVEMKLPITLDNPERDSF